MKTTLTSLILCVVASLGFYVIKYFGVLYVGVAYVVIHSISVRSISQYFYTCAYIIDVLLQVFCGKLMQLLFTKKYDKNAPWGKAISISACLGYEQLNWNLTRFGWLVVSWLDKAEEYHCINAWRSERIKIR